MAGQGLERQRDSQRWMLDYLTMETGRSMLFANRERRYPQSVRSFSMIPKHMARLAQHKEAIARAAEAAGHNETASRLFHEAIRDYHEAQHVITVRDSPQKAAYYDRLLGCHEQIVEHAGYPIERVEIDWNGVSLSGLLHLLPDRRRAPAALFVPGMDMIKELFPSPLDNPFLKRGMHVLVVDGPGQGVSNLRKIHVTDSNYEEAASSAITYLTQRHEVDPERIVVCGVSMGSHWGVRTAAHDQRVRAVATASACYGSKVPIFEQASPRFKQIFMYMTGVRDEAEFDRMVERMTCLGYGSRIHCPSLMVLGEYDQLSVFGDSVALFEELAGPREMWILEDEGHHIYNVANLGGIDVFPMMVDWLRDAVDGKIDPKLKRIVPIPRSRGRGPYGEAVARLDEHFYF